MQRGYNFFALMVVANLVAFGLAPALADTATPAPATPPPATTAPAAPNAPPPAIPKNFDPCGGPLELLNKIGNGTACVFVAGEAAITAQYVTANVPSNTSININTGQGSGMLGISNAAHIFSYPGSVIYIGVLPRAQISITPPSFVQVNSSLAGTLTGNNVLAAGATNMTFAYKQLFFVDPTKYTMAAVDFSYTPPTGSQAFRGPGPSYTINPIFTQPLPHYLGVTLAFPITSSTVQNGPSGTHRGWTWTPELVPYWQSPGGTQLALFIQHSFNPSVTPIALSAGQLIGRHLSITASYGGFTYSTTATGPFHGLVTAATTAYPTLFSVGVNYLFGHSDLPH